MNAKKNIKDFFSFELHELKKNSTTTFDIYLFFEKNQHLLIWKYSGELIDEALLNLAHSRNIKKLWTPLSQKPAFELYLNPPVPAPTPILTPSPTPKPTPEEPVLNIQESKTKEGAAAREVLHSPTIPVEEKKEILSQFGHELIEEAIQAQNVQTLKKTKLKAKFIVQDLLLETSIDTLKATQELWKISETAPDLTHSMNVSTYAVVFAMAFGRIEPDVLGDIALAGLLHDVGTTRLSLSLLKKPWNSMNKAEKKTYFIHPRTSADLIQKHMPKIGERVRKLISQQHEQFNGEGYPEHIKGFEFDDLAQILALAELFESFSNEQWDGQTRTMKEAFQLLDQLEKEKNFPRFFNPDILGVVMKWLQNSIEKETLQGASTTVFKKSEDIMKNAS